MIVVLLVLNLFAGGGIEHEDIAARLDVLEYEARFQSCVVHIVPEQRTPADIAECQAAALVD